MSRNANAFVLIHTSSERTRGDATPPNFSLWCYLARVEKFRVRTEITGERRMDEAASHTLVFLLNKTIFQVYCGNLLTTNLFCVRQQCYLNRMSRPSASSNHIQLGSPVMNSFCWLIFGVYDLFHKFYEWMNGRSPFISFYLKLFSVKKWSLRLATRQTTTNRTAN